MPRAVVLLSGGLDSSTVLAIAKDLGFEVFALTIAYGQRHNVEIEASRRVAHAMGAKEHRVLSIPLDEFGGSALTDDIEVPKGRKFVEQDSSCFFQGSESPEEIPITYVPARNTIFLSLALAYAEVVGANDIFLGVSAVDYSGYPDCRPEFLQAFQTMARLGTKSGVEGAEITIHAPLVHLSKAETIQKGLELGVDYGLTHSCYDPVDGEACGRCDSCQLRARAFLELGIEDPILR
jgi:7-cyano-7-deazaguanine synthase